MSGADPARLAARLALDPVAQASRYRLGDGILSVATSSEPFASRLDGLFGDCRVERADPVLPCVDLTLRWSADEARGLVESEALAAPTILDFLRSAFPDRGFEAEPSSGPWQALEVRLGERHERYALGGSRLLILDAEGWPSFVGSLAVALTLSRQPERAFVHAASVAVGGRGVLIAGPKGSGKTSLALALGARGHTVLGDEIASIGLTERDLRPVRRALSVRPGPSGVGVEDLLAAHEWSTDVFPDGQRRKRVPISRVFPGPVPDSVPLSGVVLLGGARGDARLEKTPPSPEVMGSLNLLGSSLWGLPPAARAFRLISALSGVACFSVTAGTVDETATLIEEALGA